MNNILFIDDDLKYQKVIKDLLELEGYNVKLFQDPVDAFDEFKKEDYDIVLSDLVMDTIDGLQLVSLMKRTKPHIPIIILTGHDDANKESEGFDLEIDDYINKTTSFEVLLKRMARCLRVKNISSTTTELRSEKEKLHIDFTGRKVYKDNELVYLTYKEFELLALFLKNKNVVLSRDEIIDKIWKQDTMYVDQRTVDTHVKNIREKLKLSSIATVRGVGYEWFE